MEKPNDSNTSRNPDSKAAEPVNEPIVVYQRETSSKKITFSSVHDQEKIIIGTG